MQTMQRSEPFHSLDEINSLFLKRIVLDKFCNAGGHMPLQLHDPIDKSRRWPHPVSCIWTFRLWRPVWRMNEEQEGFKKLASRPIFIKNGLVWLVHWKPADWNLKNLEDFKQKYLKIYIIYDVFFVKIV
jgi:hypothetical protein